MKVWLPILVLLVGMGIAYGISLTEPETEEEEKVETSPIVQTISPAAQTHTIEVTGHGLVTPSRELSVHPELLGKVIGQHPSLVAGGYIPKGQLLLSLNPVDYKLAVDQQQALVAQAELEQEVEAARKKVAEREWQLMGKREGSSSSLANREAYERSAAARLSSAKSNVELAKLQLDRTKIYAPFNAMVQFENVEVGQVVFPQSLVAKLVGTDSYWVVADVPIHKLQHITLPKEGGATASKVTVEQTSGESTQSFEGRVMRLLTHVEPRARMAQLVIEVLDPLGLQNDSNGLPLFLGATVRVRIEGTKFPNAIGIPKVALRAQDEVWLLTDDNKLGKKKVRPLYADPNTVIIAADLEPNARIITSDLGIPVKDMELRAEEEPDVSVSQAAEELPNP